MTTLNHTFRLAAFVAASLSVAATHAETREAVHRSSNSSHVSERSSSGPNGSFFDRIEDLDQSLSTLESVRGNDERLHHLRESYDALRQSSRECERRGTNPMTGRSLLERFSSFQREASSLVREQEHTPYGDRFFEDMNRAREERTGYQLRNSSQMGLSTNVNFLHSLSTLDHRSRSISDGINGRRVAKEVSSLTDEALDLHLQGGALKFDHSFRNRLSSLDRSLSEQNAWGSSTETESLRESMSDMRRQWQLTMPEFPTW